MHKVFVTHDVRFSYGNNRTFLYISHLDPNVAFSNISEIWFHNGLILGNVLKRLRGFLSSSLKGSSSTYLKLTMMDHGSL